MTAVSKPKARQVEEFFSGMIDHIHDHIELDGCTFAWHDGALVNVSTRFVSRETGDVVIHEFGCKLPVDADLYGQGEHAADAINEWASDLKAKAEGTDYWNRTDDRPQ